jgi:phage terminase large subunit-like protein
MVCDRATEYAKSVVSGDTIAGPHVRAQCQRHISDIDADNDLIWSQEKADHAIGFFEEILVLNGGKFEGTPFLLHPSQAFIVGSIFGWLRKDGARRYRRAYIEMGKGNGKSPLAAGIGMYGLLVDGEPRAEVYAAATKRDQAMVLFRDAVAMVKQSPDLQSALQLSGGAGREWNIAHLKSGSWFRALSSDDGQSGPRPHIALCDEVHEHRDGTTIELLERGFKFREQPLLLMITNSGASRTSACWDEHSYAIKVAHRDTDDDTQFSYVCALDEDDDPLNVESGPGCWQKVNPLLGTILTEEYLSGVAKQAREMLGKRNLILRLHFCTWTDSTNAWLERQAIEQAEDVTLNIEDFYGQEAYFGLDLGSMRDMTALTMLVNDGVDEAGDPKYAMFTQGIMPAEGLEDRSKEDQTPYDVWEREGHIITTPGKMVRLDYLAKMLIDWCSDFDTIGIAYDQWLFQRFALELDAMGAELPVLEHPQGFSRRKSSPLFMPDSIESFETLLYSGRIRIKPDPAFRSAALSATFDESPAGLRRFTKQKSTSRIDLAVSSAMAAGLATCVEAPQEVSPWDEPAPELQGAA